MQTLASLQLEVEDVMVEQQGNPEAIVSKWLGPNSTKLWAAVRVVASYVQDRTVPRDTAEELYKWAHDTDKINKGRHQMVTIEYLRALEHLQSGGCNYAVRGWKTDGTEVGAQLGCNDKGLGKTVLMKATEVNTLYTLGTQTTS